MLVSLVIPAHNEERLLPATLAALHEAAHGAGLRHRRDTVSSDEPGVAAGAEADRGYEIVVAADACTDGTAAIARAHGAVAVEVEHRQIARARNAGARAASGRYLVFVDADTIVPAAALREALDAMRGGAVGGGAGIDFDGALPLWGRVLHPLTLVLMRTMRWTGGCFLFCTAEALNAVGGWDETLFASEELEMCGRLKRLGGRRRVTIIRARVLTSGRKLRAYSGWEILRRVVPIVLAGRKGVERREGLDIWYQRREEP